MRENGSMVKLFTIGFTNKSAEEFFNLLCNNKVSKIIDTRINNISQLAGFTKEIDLKYFAKKIGNIEYEHKIDYAPTKELLSRYRHKDITWKQYEKEYLSLLKTRNIKQKTNIADFNYNCFLCSEHLPDKCHRRILVEYFKALSSDLQIIHLI